MKTEIDSDILIVRQLKIGGQIIYLRKLNSHLCLQTFL